MAMPTVNEQVCPNCGPLKPFTTDGCSMWPDGNVRDCCVEHDKAYWSGGPLSLKKEADDKLKKCVQEKGEILNARLMRLGVEFGGAWWLPTSWRWGYGHRWPCYGKKSQRKTKQIHKRNSIHLPKAQR